MGALILAVPHVKVAAESPGRPFECVQGLCDQPGHAPQKSSAAIPRRQYWCSGDSGTSADWTQLLLRRDQEPDSNPEGG